MKESFITNPKVTILLTAEGDSYPTALEISEPKEKIIAHLNELNECRDVSFKKKPLLIPDQNGFRRIKETNLLYIEADRSYCTFHFLDGKKQMVSAIRLSILISEAFYHSSIIATRHIKRLTPPDCS